MATKESVKKTKKRIRSKVKGTSECPRLAIFRSNTNIYAQVIDDSRGVTLVSASSIEKSQKYSGTNIEGASKIGSLVADRAIKKGVKSVTFDRGGYKYHGRVKALAEAARSAGLNF